MDFRRYNSGTSIAYFYLTFGLSTIRQHQYESQWNTDSTPLTQYNYNEWNTLQNHDRLNYNMNVFNKPIYYKIKHYTRERLLNIKRYTNMSINPDTVIKLKECNIFRYRGSRAGSRKQRQIKVRISNRLDSNINVITTNSRVEMHKLINRYFVSREPR